jgi:hypothetical protein
MRRIVSVNCARFSQQLQDAVCFGRNSADDDARARPTPAAHRKRIAEKLGSFANRIFRHF